MSRASRRFYRSTGLGLAALGVLVWAAVDQFGIPPEELTELFLRTLGVAGGIIAIAAFLLAVSIGVRKLLQRNASDSLSRGYVLTRTFSRSCSLCLPA